MIFYIICIIYINISVGISASQVFQHLHGIQIWVLLPVVVCSGRTVLGFVGGRRGSGVMIRSVGSCWVGLDGQAAMVARW